jgi:TATA box binding protein associated factor (TAF)
VRVVSVERVPEPREQTPDSAPRTRHRQCLSWRIDYVSRKPDRVQDGAHQREKDDWRRKGARQWRAIPHASIVGSPATNIQSRGMAASGVWPSDSVKVRYSLQQPASVAHAPHAFKDIAESLGIASLSDTVASALAADIEYRLHEVIEVRSPDTLSTLLRPSPSHAHSSPLPRSRSSSCAMLAEQNSRLKT